jgi:hypothetical protein
MQTAAEADDWEGEKKTNVAVIDSETGSSPLNQLKKQKWHPTLAAIETHSDDLKKKKKGCIISSVKSQD